MFSPLSLDEFLTRDLAWATRQWALLDLREAGEFAKGHIPGATSLPRRMLEFRLSEILPDPSWPLVIYDHGAGDQRAAFGAARLAEIGISDVRILDGGIAAWQGAGQTLATGTNVPCKKFGETVLHSDRIQSIAPKDLQNLREERATLAICDVRTSDEYAIHHLPDALSFPGFELAGYLPQLMRDHSKVVLNCAGRTRSIIATATAQALGFDCLAVENGTMGWRLAGFETASGVAAQASGPGSQDAMAIAERARVLAVEAGVTQITAEGLEVLRRSAGRNRPYVIDLRPRDAFKDGHITGAIWLPGGQSIQRTDDFIAVPGAPIVVVDGGDARGHLAAWWLKRMGFAAVQVLDGGMPAWRSACLEIERGRGHPRPPLLNRFEGRFTTLGVSELLGCLKQAPPPIIIDVSTSKSFVKGHLPGAIWISRGWLEAEISTYAGLDAEIVLSASDPAQALLAAVTLRRLRYTNVRVSATSLTAWARAGGPIETGGLTTVPDDIVEPPYEQGLQAMRDYLDWEIRLMAGEKTPPNGATVVEKE